LLTQIEDHTPSPASLTTHVWQRLERPLHSVVGLADILHDRSRDVSAAARNEMIDQLAIHARILERSLNDIIVATNVARAEIEFAIDAVDLREVVGDVAGEWALERGGQVVLSGAVDAVGDREWMRYALRNLFEDAYLRGARTIEVRMSEGYSKVVVAIDDDGETIPATEIEALAASPGRGHALDWQGTVLGQGSALARELVKGMGGELRYFGSDGVNSCELTLRKLADGSSRRHRLPSITVEPISGRPTREDIMGLLEDDSISMVYQPIVDIRTGGAGEPSIIGYESLARFPFSTPQDWFETAVSAGIGVDLELLAMNAGIETFVPHEQTRFLALNLSNATLLSPQLPAAIEGIDAGRIVLELSDTARIRSYEVSRRAVENMRQRGIRLAVDDVGASEIDMWHILRLDPEIIKIDRHLVADENVRRNDALIRGITTMARDLGIMVIAEAIETETERQRLLDLGVEFGQGYLFGKPQALQWKTRVLGDSRH
jgi:EAL domain-containing protein (putative c-di-GMP-specific phosphodiesterase class I)